MTPKSLSAGGSWSWQNPRPNGNPLFGISCPVPGTCYAAGAEGPMLMTKNGGATWTQLTMAIGINGISCGSAAFCVAVGNNGLVMSTLDSGATWTSQYLNYGNFLAGVSCPASNTCFAVGYAGSLMATTDGGASWARQDSRVSDNLFGVSCVSSSCYAVGTAGVITGTTFDQSNWTVKEPSGSSSADLNAISCTTVGVPIGEMNSCIAVGTHGAVVSGTNTVTASTWQFQAAGISANLFGVSCTSATQCLASADDGNAYIETSSAWGAASTRASGSLWAISCPTTAACLAAGDYGVVVSTTNGGTGWTQQSPNAPLTALMGVDCPSTTACTIVGNGGAIMGTSDGGGSWLSETSGTTTNLAAVDCPSSTTCFAVGAAGKILDTVDGGVTWTAQSSGVSVALGGVDCPSTSDCIAVGGGGTVLGTTNGGTTWSVQTSGTINYLAGVSCASTSVCTVVGNFIIIGTTNGGGTWSTQPSLGAQYILSVSCTDTTHCVAAGGPSTFLTTANGGATWAVTSLNNGEYFNAVSCPTTSICFASGGPNSNFFAYKTTDGGSTWTPEIGPGVANITGLSCPSATTCFAVSSFGPGSGGAVMRTTDGGATDWRLLAPSGTTDNLYGVSCPSVTTCFAASATGLLGTTNGGLLWAPLFSVPNTTFTAVSCPTTTVCFAVARAFSNAGAIFATIDGGGTWTDQLVTFNPNFIAISCGSSLTCVAAQANGNISVTGDGGAHWSFPNQFATTLSGVSCPDANHCFATDAGVPGNVYESTNSGSTWAVSFNLASDPFAGSGGPFAAISCPSISVCYASGTGGLVATTTDGGANWRTDNIPLSRQLNSISCPGVSTCYATTGRSEILQTTNFGGTWAIEYGGAAAAFQGISCPSASVCFAVGSAGVITATTNGGAAWTTFLPADTTSAILSMSCTTASDCYAVAGDTTLVTHNGGTTWASHVNISTDFLDSVSCPATNTCFAVGWPGAIYFSGDGGTTWNYQPSFLSGADEVLFGVSCISATSCVAVGTLGTIISTTNGATWGAETSGTTQILTSVSCPSTSNCVAVGFNGLAMTRTGGVWKIHASGTTLNLTGITCPSAMVCYAVGVAGKVLVTQNQGGSWTSQASGTVHDLYSVSCARPPACLAVGNFGIAVVTLDGSHWSSLSTPTFNALRAVVFEDLNHAWVAGFGGTILANSSLTPGCGSASVAASPASPQPAGTALGLTASSIGCPSPTYEFWIQNPSGAWYLIRSWGGPTFSWNTTGLAPGSYTVHVWANQLGDSMSTYEALGGLTFVLTGCTAASLLPPGVTQTVGSTVSLTANATGCPDPEFEYWVQYPTGAWYLLRSWGGATFNWPTTGLTPGLYTVHVWANQRGASLATYETIGADTVALSLCAGALLSPTNPSAPAGSTVVLTASSTSCVTPRYEFWVQYPDSIWHLVVPYGPSAVFNWNTNGLAPGSYTVHVWAKSLGDPIGTFEVLGSDTVTLTGCTIASVSPPSPTQGAGTTVSLTGGGADCPNPQFEFWVQYPDLTWHLGRSWGAAAWNWVTTGLKPGGYTIHSWTNQIGASIATYEAIGSAAVTLSGCTAASVAPPTGSDTVGATIKFTVTPTCPTTAIYEFWLQYPDLSWHLQQGFSATNTWTWHSTGFPKGSYVIHVWVNNQNADMSIYETIGSATHTLN